MINIISTEPDGIRQLENIKETVKNMEYDAVERPKHYNREGGMECIDEMVLVFGKDAVKHFCLCNAWKYRYRAADKNGEEDLKKSDWYLRKYKKLSESSPTLTITSTTPVIDTFPPIVPV